MRITPVTERRTAFGAVDEKRENTRPALSVGTATFQKTDEAVIATLRNRRTPTSPAEVSEIQYDEIDPALTDSTFGRALLGVLNLSRKLRSTAEQYNQFGISGERQKTIGEELSSIGNELKKIIGSDDFTQIQEIVTGASDRLTANKEEYRGYVRTYQSAIGDEFVGLVERGENKKLDRISRNVAMLATADIDGNLTNPEFAKALEETVLDTFAALAGQEGEGVNGLASFSNFEGANLIEVQRQSVELMKSLVERMREAEREGREAQGDVDRGYASDLLSEN